MNYSIVITVFNEEKSISRLVEDLVKQITPRGEIVIVDGGSRDNTYKILLKFSSKYKKIRIYKKIGNIASGRNFGIKKAKHTTIVMTDAGVILHNNWLQEILKSFRDKQIDCVAGFYKMTGNNLISAAAIPFLGVTQRKYNKDIFLPSCRSIAFRKNIWKKIGGFNENLPDAGEDTLFNYGLVEINAKIVRNPKAIVYWEVPNNLFSMFKKFYRYAKGDGYMTILWNKTQRFNTHFLKILTIYIRYFLLIFLLYFDFYLFIILLFLYIFYAIYKNKDEDLGKSLIFTPLIQILSDFAVMIGFFRGIIDKAWDIVMKQ